MASATLTSKGQITIPKPVRDRMHLQPGDKLEFHIQDDETILLEPATGDISELDGLLHDPSQHSVSVEDMNDVIQKEAASLNQESLS